MGIIKRSANNKRPHNWFNITLVQVSKLTRKIIKGNAKATKFRSNLRLFVALKPIFYWDYGYLFSWKTKLTSMTHQLGWSNLFLKVCCLCALSKIAFFLILLDWIVLIKIKLTKEDSLVPMLCLVFYRVCYYWLTIGRFNRSFH